MSKKELAPLKQDRQISSKDKFYLVMVVLVVLTAFILMLVNGAQQKSKAQVQPTINIASTSTKPSIEDIVEKLSALIFNQTEEKPLVVSIVNIEELQTKDPIFYKDAKNGDKIFIWAEKIALYSSEADKLMAVMPRALWDQVNLPASSSTDSTQVKALDEKATITVKNGTTKAGVAKEIADLLIENGLDVIKTGDAKSKAYTQSQIIRLSEKAWPKTEEILTKNLKVDVVQGDAANYSDMSDYIVIVGLELVSDN